MSIAKDLSQKTLARLQDRFKVQEVLTDDGPYMTLASPMSPAPVGSVRLFSGGPVHKMVYVGLVVPPIQLDSHMIFAFTAPDSPIPHFTLDSVKAGEHNAFHLDLIPRVDLGANLDYINAVFHPLTEVYEETRQLEGLSPAHLSPRQYAIMSSWMLAARATDEAFVQIEQAINKYLEHWFGLVENGLSNEITASLSDTNFAKRDQRNRNALFNAEVDPVWNQVARLVGDETSNKIRELLRTQDMPE